MIEIDFSYLSYITVPPNRRVQKNLDLYDSFNYGVSGSYESMKTERLNDIEEISHTGQVLSIENYINYHLGVALNYPVYLTEGYLIDSVYIYNKGEFNPDTYYIYTKSEFDPQPNFLPKYYLYNSDEYDALQYDFVVNIHAEDNAQEQKIKDIVNKYKISGKTYIVNFYTFS